MLDFTKKTKNKNKNKTKNFEKEKQGEFGQIYAKKGNEKAKHKTVRGQTIFTPSTDR